MSSPQDPTQVPPYEELLNLGEYPAFTNSLDLVRRKEIDYVRRRRRIAGKKDGPARESMDRTQLEKRLTILACYFKHDSARIIGEAPGMAGHRDVRVELKKGNITRQTTFYTIKGPGDRWYVENMDLASVRDFCGNTGTTTR